MIWKRVLTGWTFGRFAYAAVGLYIVSQAVADKEWSFLPLGLYFASMGIFAFGCAAGQCAAPLNKTSEASAESVSFEVVSKKEN